MKPKTAKILISIFVVVVAGAVLYHTLFSTKTIYTYSYGRETTFELAEIEEVSNIDIYHDSPDESHVYFKVPDKGAFIDNHVLPHENYVTSYELYHEYHMKSGGYHRTFYLFEYEEHLFSLHYNDNTDQFRMGHVGADMGDIHLYVPFPVNDWFTESRMDFSDPVLWSDVSWTPWESFEDAVEFYETLSDDQSDIDYEKKTIDLNGLINRYGEVEGFTEGHPIRLRFTEDGFMIEHEDLTD